MQRLLKYLIHHSYENNQKALQQKAIAVECLGRTSEFIPSQDPIVRIEAARLRKLLDAFYEETQQSIPYRVSLPKGSYRVGFSRNEDNTLSSGLCLLIVCQSSQQASSEVLQLMLKIRRELSDRLSRFHHVELTVEYLPKHQVAQEGSVHFLVEKQHDYVLRVEVVSDEKGGYLVSSVVIHRVSQEILWSNSIQVPIDNHSESLDVFYKHLVRSLVADSFGLLGRHWANLKREEGLGNIPSHQVSWVHLIGLANKPCEVSASHYLEFLAMRLKACPNDHIAYAGYQCLVFYDFSFKYGLIDSSLEERYEQLLRVTSEYPAYDVFTVLLGLYSFAVGEYERAKTYLETGRRLNPYNSTWGFLYGGALFFMDEREEGMEVINEVNKGFNEGDALPGFYLLPEFLYHLDQGDPSKAFQLSIKLGINSKQWSDIGALKNDPELVSYCLNAVKAPSSVS